MSGVDPRRLADSYAPNFGTLWQPVLASDQLAKMTDEQLYYYHSARKQVEAMVAANPVGAGWVLPSWQKVMQLWSKYPIHIILGGVRSTKSSLASRLCVWALGNIPEAELRCYHVNEDRSKQDQQRFIYDALPVGIRELPVKKGKFHSVQYSQKNGFTGDVCILPPLPGWERGGRIDFGNYRQYQQDSKVTEGYKAHVIWGDEEMPPKMFETLTYRTSDYHGRVILTFTTLEGWTPLVQDILGKTKTLETRWSDLVGRNVPVLQESLSRPGTCIHYFWTEDNPFIDVLEFKNKLRGRSRDEIMARAHGIPTKSATSVFTLFDREVGGNVVKHEDLPFIKNKNYPVTRYMAIDPAGSKNWFILWVAVDAAGTWWVYREWPDYDDWALPGATAEGKPGPAQRGEDRGIREYVELMLQCEGRGDVMMEEPEEIFERLIDPRLGAAERQADEGATNIISDLDRHDMMVVPAPGVDIENGLQILRGLMAWNPAKPRNSLNSPKFYVSDRCANTIYALAEYTAKGGREEATKDPIDCFDAETEILTEDGWVKFPALERGKKVATLAVDGHLEFQTPTEYHDKEYTGPMIAVSTQSLDFRVTPNHRMLVYPQQPRLKVRLAKDLRRQDTIPITSLGLRNAPVPEVEIWPGKIVDACDWAEFIGWYVSEGSVTGAKGGKIQIPGRGYSVYISQSRKANSEKCRRIEAVLDRLGFCWHYNGGSYAISSKNLWSILIPLGDQKNRYIPRDVLALPRACLERLWSAMVLGDGWMQNSTRHYASISTRLINDVTELLSLLGKGYGGVYVRNPKPCKIKGRKIIGVAPLMMIAEKKLRAATITTKDRKMLLRSEEYSGRVYCVSVPNGTLLVRRNNRAMFAGNCLRYMAVSNIQFFSAADRNFASQTRSY